MAQRFIRTDASPETIRALWDQLHTMNDALTSAQATIKAQSATLASQTALLSTHASKITQALAASGKFTGTSSSGTGGTGGSGGGTGPIVPNHLDIVQAVLGIMPLTGASPNADIFAFAQEVVWRIFNLGTDPPGMLVGLLYQAAGDGVYTCAGTPYATFRICYDNGANIKILTGSYTAQWTPEAPIPIADWRAPVDPASPC